MLAAVVVTNENLWAVRAFVPQPAAGVDAFFVVPLLCERGVCFITVGAGEVPLLVGLHVLAERRYRDIAGAAFITAVISIMAAHVMIKVFERDVNDGAYDASKIVTVFETERKDDVFNVFVDSLVVDED